MASQAFVRQEIVDAGIIDVNHIVCPGCGKNTLVLIGQATIPQQEFMEDGLITGRLPGIYEDGAFDLQQINCMSCNTQYIIRDHELFRLEREVESLRAKLAEKKGKSSGGYIN